MTLLIFGVLLALIVSSLLGGRKEKKRYEQMLASIKKHDQVRTAGGIIAPLRHSGGAGMTDSSRSGRTPAPSAQQDWNPT